VFIFEKPEALI